MMPSSASLTLHPIPLTNRSRVAARSGVPITRWPKRRGGRGPSNTAGARSFNRTWDPGVLGVTSWVERGAAAAAARTVNSTLSIVDYRHRASCRLGDEPLPRAEATLRRGRARLRTLCRSDQTSPRGFIEDDCSTTICTGKTRVCITTQAHLAVKQPPGKGIAHGNSKARVIGAGSWLESSFSTDASIPEPPDHLCP